MMWCNYLQGDLFERFYSNNLLTTSDIMCGILLNCALCSPTRRNSTRCACCKRQKFHRQNNLHFHDNAQASVITVLCFLGTALESSLCLSSCLLFSRPKLYCAELSLTIGCHGDAQQLGLMACWKGLARFKSKELFFTSCCFLTLIAVRPHVK